LRTTVDRVSHRCGRRHEFCATNATNTFDDICSECPTRTDAADHDEMARFLLRTQSKRCTKSRDEEQFSADVGDTRKRLVRTMWNSTHWRNRHDAMRCFCVEREAFRADAEYENARHALIRAARFIHALRDQSRVLFEITLAQRAIEKSPHPRQRVI
jgi:hypothetical protein